MDGVGRELPHLQALHGELGHQLDRLRVVVHHHELAQLVVGLKPGQEADEDTGEIREMNGLFELAGDSINSIVNKVKREIGTIQQLM